MVPALGAQWEYACRTGTSGPSYAKPVQSLADIAWYDQNSGGQTRDAKGKAPNKWGLYDMLGNVFEWCADGWVGPQGRDVGIGFRLARVRTSD